MTLTDLKSEIEARLTKGSQSQESVWRALVESSRQMHGDGCGASLLDQAVKCGLEILSGVSDDDLANIWKETENGIMAMEEGETDATRVQMLLDIEVELYKSVCERVCEEGDIPETA
ncbi:MAG: hypothetical protein NTV79_11515 [Candidatus Aureabacteria bacterium]|nr:hypothetical protein [Candidatus Auribacterota bacterium]